MEDDWFEAPLGVFVTFRTYATWLHGDDRTSVDRRNNVYGAPRIAPNPRWKQYVEQTLLRDPVVLDSLRRRVTDEAIRLTCNVRQWHLFALNVRTNHVHVVYSAPVPAARAVTAFKANATRKMRVSGCWSAAASPWASGASKRYLWNTTQLQRAITYVLAGQGAPLD